MESNENLKNDPKAPYNEQQLKERVEESYYQQKDIQDMINPFSYAEGFDKDTFQKYDTDNDGFLSKTELQKYFNDNEWSEKHANMCLTDLNNDNKLSYGELKLIENYNKDIKFEKFSAKYGEAEANDFFKTYDANGDKVVTQDEIEAHDSKINSADNATKPENDTKNNDTKKGISNGDIIAIIICGLVVFGLIAALIVYLSRSKKGIKKQDTEREHSGNSFDKDRKDISYNVSNNLNSVNRSHDMQR